MKKSSIFVLGLAGLFAVSCTNVEKSDEYQALLAEKDSLAVVASNVNTDYDAALNTINEIENALEAVRAAEGIIMVENQEGNTNKAVSQINAIQETLQQNRQKIADLEKQLASQGSKSKALGETISRLKTQLDEKDTFISSLRDEIQNKNVQISELHDQVANLNENIDSLTVQSAQQQATIQGQDEAMHTVWYFIGTQQVLIEKGLVSKGGLFKGLEVLKQGFDNGVFHKADKRQLSSIPLNTKKATILTQHPDGSYEITKGEDENLTLNITNPAAFWNISNYLIVSIK